MIFCFCTWKKFLSKKEKKKSKQKKKRKTKSRITFDKIGQKQFTKIQINFDLDRKLKLKKIESLLKRIFNNDVKIDFACKVEFYWNLTNSKTFYV